jgi:hypothetical protein
VRYDDEKKIKTVVFSVGLKQKRKTGFILKAEEKVLKYFGW